MPRTALTLFCATTLLLLAACSKQSAPDYDRVSMLLLNDLFAAIEEGEHDAAISKLERFGDLNPDVMEVQDLMRIEQDTTMRLAAGEALKRGGIPSAIQAVRAARLKHGSTISLNAANDSLEGLLAIEKYQDQRQSNLSPRDLASAVASLPDPSLYPDHTAYRTWHANQRLAAAAALQELKQTRIRTTITTIAQTLVEADSNRLTLLLDDLAALNEDNGVVSAVAIAPHAVGLPHQWRSLGSQQAAEVVAFCYYYQGPAKDRDDIGALTTTWKQPKTPCGHYLLADLAMARGDATAAFAHLKHLTDSVPDTNFALLLPSMAKLVPPGEAPPPSPLGIVEELTRLAR